MKKIMFYLSLVIFLICIIYSFVIVLMNIDMTELRLLVTYWKEWLFIMGLGLVGMCMLNKSMD